MRIIKNEKGTYCTDCKQSNKCVCFPDEETVELLYRKVLKDTGKATLILLKKQTLSTGKKIKSRIDIWFPNHLLYIDDILKIVKVPGKLVNQIVNV